jgi:predicted  nucleic acid-binding Zn-ribbon protein
LSSSRGPGVIGTVIALFVLVGFGTLYMFVFDEGLQGGQKKIEAVIRDQGIQIDSQKLQIEENQKRVEAARQFKAVSKEADELILRGEHAAKRVAELEQARQAAAAEVEAANQAWAKYRDDYRASEWAAAVGEKFDEIKTPGGEVYSNAVIRKISHKGIDVLHSNGLKLIATDDLPPELKDRFQFDAEKTEEDARSTGITVGIHTDNVEIATLATKANEKLARVRELEAQNQRLNAEIEEAKLNIPRHASEIAGMQSAIVLERTKKLSKAPQMEARLAEMKKAAEKSQASISTNGAKVQQARIEIDGLNRDVAAMKDEIARIKKDLEGRAAPVANP